MTTSLVFAKKQFMTDSKHESVLLSMPPSHIEGSYNEKGPSNYDMIDGGKPQKASVLHLRIVLRAQLRIFFFPMFCESHLQGFCGSKLDCTSVSFSHNDEEEQMMLMSLLMLLLLMRLMMLLPASSRLLVPVGDSAKSKTASQTFPFRNACVAELACH